MAALIKINKELVSDREREEELFPTFLSLESNSKPKDRKDDFSFEPVASEFLWITQVQRKVRMGKMP